MVDASIIIVNYNTRNLLLECLKSVYSTMGRDGEVWVVDNGSTDGSQDAVKRVFPQTRLLENGSNLGFAKANNMALRLIQGRYAVLLNSDARLTPGAVKTLVHFMDANPRVGVSGPRLLNEDGTPQNSIANIPTLATELLNKSLLRRLFPKRYPGKELRIEGPIEVESVIGACMVVRKKAVDEVGLLDEDFFFFLEETDWCKRMRQAGWKVFFLPASRVYHLKGASANRVNRKARVEYWRSRYTFFRKHGSPAERVFLAAGLFVRLLIGLAASLVHNISTLFMSKSARNRMAVSLNLVIWHIAGCPRSWGLSRGA